MGPLGPAFWTSDDIFQTMVNPLDGIPCSLFDSSECVFTRCCNSDAECHHEANWRDKTTPFSWALRCYRKKWKHKMVTLNIFLQGNLLWEPMDRIDQFVHIAGADFVCNCLRVQHPVRWDRWVVVFHERPSHRWRIRFNCEWTNKEIFPCLTAGFSFNWKASCCQHVGFTDVKI